MSQKILYIYANRFSNLPITFNLMGEPLISIILPVYNGEKFLYEAISSCLEQTYKNLELIIINDCSTDRSLVIAEAFAEKDDRVKVITNTRNQKLPASLNIGHAVAQGEYITWTSDDNLYHKNAVEWLLKSLKETNADVVYSNYLIINEAGDLVGVSHLKEIEYLLFHGVVGASFLYKKSVYHRNEKYNEDLFLVEDLDFWIRALKHSTFHKITNPGFYYYRYHSNSLTTKIQNDPAVRAEFLNNLASVYDQNLDLGLEEKEIVIRYFLETYKRGRKKQILPLSKYFFSDVDKIAAHFKGIKSKTIKRIIFLDVVDAIMATKKFQRISILMKLHLRMNWFIAEMPIKSYLSLVTKCLKGGF